MTEESWSGEWLRREIAEETGREVFDVLRSFRVGGGLVELLHNPASGYAFARYEDDGSRKLMATPDQSFRSMLETVDWSKLKRTGRVWGA